LISQGYQCQVVDYNDPASLQYALGGVDTVISTVTGTPQLRLIEAAVQSRVRRFAPAEFEGQPGLRGQIDVLDRGKNAALALLRHYQGYIQSTVFVCGILYERFSVNGMRSQHMGSNTGYGNEGDFIANPRTMTALAPIWDAGHNLSCLCLTSAHDVCGQSTGYAIMANGDVDVRREDDGEWPVGSHQGVQKWVQCSFKLSTNQLTRTRSTMDQC
jgi:hypothetical protein